MKQTYHEKGTSARYGAFGFSLCIWGGVMVAVL